MRELWKIVNRWGGNSLHRQRAGVRHGGVKQTDISITGKAHQRVIRERKAIEAASENIFGAWWETINRDISNGIVKEIDRATCERIILEYEWLGCMPAVVWHMYGIFFDGNCAGVVCYGPEYSENLGKVARERGLAGADWSKYGFEGKMILLSRGACVHWAHPHSGSKLIRQSMKMLPKKYEVVTCTTDEAAGEIGTIYQACSFFYVGSMRDSNPNVKSKRLDRDGWEIDGKIYGPRTMRQKLGCSRMEEILKVYPTAKKIKQHSKHRYFAFRGSKKQQKEHFQAIASLVKPYPKRNASEVSKAICPAVQQEGSGDESTTTLQFNQNKP